MKQYYQIKPEYVNMPKNHDKIPIMSLERTELFKTPAKGGEFFESVHRRNSSIPRLIRENRVLQERKTAITALVRTLGLWYVRQGSSLEGQQNIEEALKLSDNGIPLVTISDHQSDSDHAIKRIVLARSGLGSFADNTVYLGGLKMIERRDISFFASSENMLLIPTPFDIESVEQALKLSDLTEMEMHVLRRLKRNYTNLSIKAIRKASSMVKENPRQMIGLYPESTRSRTGLIGEVRPETNMWYRFRNETYIVPVAVEGGDYFHPPGTFPFKRVDARVAVGEPVPFEKILKRAKTIPKPQREQYIADVSFALVVSMLNPKHVPQSQRAYFAELASF